MKTLISLLIPTFFISGFFIMGFIEWVHSKSTVVRENVKLHEQHTLSDHDKV